MSEAEAIHHLLYKFHLGDHVYTIREGADMTGLLAKGQSSWDHPDVVLFSECVAVLENNYPVPTQGDTE